MKIHPDTSTTSNSIDYPLDTVTVMDSGSSQPSNNIFTTVIKCCSTTATTSTTTITTATSDISQHAVSFANDKAQLFTAKIAVQTHVMEQKIITEIK